MIFPQKPKLPIPRAADGRRQCRLSSRFGFLSSFALRVSLFSSTCGGSWRHLRGVSFCSSSLRWALGKHLQTECDVLLWQRTVTTSGTPPLSLVAWPDAECPFSDPLGFPSYFPPLRFSVPLLKFFPGLISQLFSVLTNLFTIREPILGKRLLHPPVSRIWGRM